MMLNPDWFAGRLKELRTEAELTQQALTEKAGLKSGSVRDIEQGIYPPNWPTVLALCDALNVVPDAFTIQPTTQDKSGPGRPKKTTEPAAEGPGKAAKKGGAK